MKQLTEKQFKKAWVKALRSGRYKQGKEELLSRNNEYCCLGVGCRVLGIKKSTILHETYPSEINIEFPIKKIDKKEFVNIGVLNDEGGYTFEEISYFIENGY